MQQQPIFTDAQLQQIASMMFSYLKEAGMSHKEIVRIVGMLTGSVTEDLSAA